MRFTDRGVPTRDCSEAVRRFYETEAARYDEVRWQSRAGAWTDKVQRQIVQEMLGTHGSCSTRQVLELAIGTGRIGTDLAQAGWGILGIDVAFNMLRLTQQKAVRAATQLYLVQGRVEQVPVRSESFAVCICVNALSLMPRYQEGLREIARVLKPGGVLICNFANLLSYYLPFGLISNYRKRALVRDVYCRWHRLTTLQQELERAGFEISDVRGHVHLPGYVKGGGILPFVKALDKLSRNSRLRYLCPTVFFKLIRR